MDDKQAAMITAILVRIAEGVETLARSGQPEEPNLIKSLADYAGFDWQSIGASIVQADRDGPTHLEYNGFIWTRRSPQNKYSPAVWYSRSSGRDEEGNVKYLKLITFRTLTEAESIPDKVTQALHQPTAQPPGNNGKKKAGPESIPPPPAKGSPKKSDKKPEPESSSGPQPGGDPGEFIDSSKYYTDAGAKRWNIGQKMAVEIAKVAGVDLAAKKPDFQAAYVLLPYFAECTARGMDFDSAGSVLKAHKLDPAESIYRIRELTPGKD